MIRNVLPLVLTCVVFDTATAEEGRLSGVGPFAIYTEFDGFNDGLQKKAQDTFTSLLKKMRVPIVESKNDMRIEDSPFLHFELQAIRNEKPPGFLLFGRFSVKTAVTNPANGRRIVGLIGSSHKVVFSSQTEGATEDFLKFLASSLYKFAEEWQLHNPLPDEINPEPGG